MLVRTPMKKTLAVAVLLGACASPALCGRGFRGGFSAGSGSHRVVTLSKPQTHKPPKAAKPPAHPKTAQSR